MTGDTLWTHPTNDFTFLEHGAKWWYIPLPFAYIFFLKECVSSIEETDQASAIVQMENPHDSIKATKTNPRELYFECHGSRCIEQGHHIVVRKRGEQLHETIPGESYAAFQGIPSNSDEFF